MPTDKKAITVYLGERLYKRVAAAAKADGRSISNFVEHALDALAPHELGERRIMASRVAPDRSGS
jgi:predicted HicB family RNase H-like nuclease